MELFANLGIGLTTAFSWTNLIYCFIGVALGTLIGVLPGLGPTATIAMLLPITFNLEPVSALIMLAGIYYGSQYGGSTTSILINVPGEAAAVITTLDGHQMARRGDAGKALAVAALGSFIAGTIATLFIALFAPFLAEFALQFGPAEYFSLLVLGLVMAIVLARSSLLHAWGMVILGLLVGLIGTDINSGITRFTFNIPELADGISFVVVAMGLFGITEIVRSLEENPSTSENIQELSHLMLNREDWKHAWPAILRGTVLGSAMGLLPGSGSILGAFAAYSLEKKISSYPHKFGTGVIEGVAAPESANNAGAQTSFIPMLTLGIPSNPVMALMLGALILHGIIPGPLLMTEQPHLFWGVIVSMWIGNLFLVILNLPLIGVWVKLLTVPYSLLYPAILVFCVIGAFSLNNSELDIYLMALFGLCGYIFYKLDCEPAPFLLGYILGPMMEEYLRRALLISHGDPLVFIQRPISVIMLSIALASVIAMWLAKFSPRYENLIE